MKRLIKKSENINVYNDEKEEAVPEDMSNMTLLDQLSEADIRHDRCPQCGYNELQRSDGFKICPRCESNYKILDGHGYLINK